MVTGSAGGPRPGAPLPDRTLVRTSDPDELTAVGADLFSPHRLHFRGSSARLAAVDVGGGRLISLEYAGESRVAVTEPLDYVAVHLPLAGRGEVRFGRDGVHTGPGRGVLFNEGDRPTMRWSPDLAQLAVRVPAPLLRGHAVALAGGAAGRELRLDHAATTGEGWSAALRTLAAVEAGYAGEPLPPALGDRLLEMFLTALLTTQRHNWSEAMLAAPPVPRRAVQAVVDAVEADPARPWSASSLATAGGVGLRALQEGFRRERGTSPTAFVREVRLQRVHRDLLDPASAGRSVTEIALDAGFTHLGRFSAHYRRRFGHSPSRTRGRP